MKPCAGCVGIYHPDDITDNTLVMGVPDFSCAVSGKIWSIGKWLVNYVQEEGVQKDTRVWRNKVYVLYI